MPLPNNRSMCAGASPKSGELCLERDACARHVELKRQQKRGRKDFADSVILPLPCRDGQYPYRIKLVAA